MWNKIYTYIILPGLCALSREDFVSHYSRSHQCAHLQFASPSGEESQQHLWRSTWLLSRFCPSSGRSHLARESWSIETAYKSSVEDENLSQILRCLFVVWSFAVARPWYAPRTISRMHTNWAWLHAVHSPRISMYTSCAIYLTGACNVVFMKRKVFWSVHDVEAQTDI